MKNKLLFCLVLVSLFLVVSCAQNLEGFVDTANVYQTDLPVVSIQTDQIINSKDTWVENIIITIDGEEFLGASIKGRGNSSWGMPKKSYSIKLDKKSKVLGMSKSKRWVLIANYSDKTLIRNDLASYLANNIFTNMDWSPEFKAVELSINGEYKGSYLLGEQIKIDEKRINIEDISEAKNIEDGGFILEINARQDEAYNFVTTHGVAISLKDPDEVSAEIQTRVHDIVQLAEDVIFSSTFADINPATGKANYESVIDVDSLIDWYFVNELAKNRDCANFSSIYLYYDPSDKLLHMGPVWDFDIGFGNDGETQCYDYKGWYISSNIWFEQLSKDPNFVQRVKDRWNAVYSKVVESADVIYVKAEYLAKSADMNFKRWTILGAYVWPNPDGYLLRRTYMSEVDWLYNWYVNRINWINTEINK